jgi:hypothetical protein
LLVRAAFRQEKILFSIKYQHKVVL